MAEVEFWPEYGSGPLWIAGSSVEPTELVGAELAERLIAWNDQYDDEKLPADGSSGDSGWLAEGKELLRLVRERLDGNHVVQVTEPWWD